MENQEGFKEALGDLLAEASGHRLTEEEIQDCFSGWALDREQWNLIYSYLELNQIAVEGHGGDAESLSYLKGGREEKDDRAKEQTDRKDKLTGEDSRCYQMYLEELETIREIQTEELETLLAALARGEKYARDRLAEGHLRRVVELAREYAGQGVLMADLIQEGNMALLLAMDTFDSGDFGVHITREICSAMDLAIAEQTGQDDTGSYLASQANAMMKATEELVEELGREATLPEVARKMNLSEEMRRDIMKISMDALSVVEANQTGEIFGEGIQDHDHDHSHDHGHGCGCGE